MNTRAKIILTVSILSAPLLFVPFPSRIADATSLRFVREGGDAVAGIKVDQQWESYGYGLSGEGQISEVSSPEGMVEYAPRSAYGSLGARILGRALAVIAVHSSYGSDVSVEFELPVGMRVNFKDARFSKLEPFENSGSYVDKTGRVYYSRVWNDVERVDISGNFSAHADYIEIPVTSKKAEQDADGNVGPAP